MNMVVTVGVAMSVGVAMGVTGVGMGVAGVHVRVAVAVAVVLVAMALTVATMSMALLVPVLAVVAVVAVVAAVPRVTHPVCRPVCHCRHPPCRTRTRRMPTACGAGNHVSSRFSCGRSGSSSPISRQRQKRQQENRRRGRHSRDEARGAEVAVALSVRSAHHSSRKGGDDRCYGAAWPPHDEGAGMGKASSGWGKMADRQRNVWEHASTGSGRPWLKGAARARRREPLAAAPLPAQVPQDL